MANLHTTGDVSRFIGALEFGTDLGDGNDNALELTGGHMTAGPTTSCPVTSPYFCHRVDDGALETAGKFIVAGPPTAAVTGCTLPPLCRRIDDDALEMVGKAVTANPTTHPSPITHRCM